MLLPVVERQAGSAERLIAQVTMSGMCIAQVSVAIEAFCHDITVARIADGVLNIRHFDDSAFCISWHLFRGSPDPTYATRGAGSAELLHHFLPFLRGAEELLDLCVAENTLLVRKNSPPGR